MRNTEKSLLSYNFIFSSSFLSFSLLPTLVTTLQPPQPQLSLHFTRRLLLPFLSLSFSSPLFTFYFPTFFRIILLYSLLSTNVILSLSFYLYSIELYFNLLLISFSIFVFVLPFLISISLSLCSPTVSVSSLFPTPTSYTSGLSVSLFARFRSILHLHNFTFTLTFTSFCSSL